MFLHSKLVCFVIVTHMQEGGKKIEISLGLSEIVCSTCAIGEESWHEMRGSDEERKW